jgi:putative endonuclease
MVVTSTGAYYTGISLDVTSRVETHNKGKGAKALRGQLPVRLVWKSEALDHAKAAVEEARIKKLSHKDKETFANEWYL